MWVVGWDVGCVSPSHPIPSHPIPSLVQVLGVNSRNRIVDRLARMQESRAPIGAGCDGIAGRDPISYGRGGMGREGLLASIEPVAARRARTDHRSWIMDHGSRTGVGTDITAQGGVGCGGEVMDEANRRGWVWAQFRRTA